MASIALMGWLLLVEAAEATPASFVGEVSESLVRDPLDFVAQPASLVETPPGHHVHALFSMRTPSSRFSSGWVGTVGPGTLAVYGELLPSSSTTIVEQVSHFERSTSNYVDGELDVAWGWRDRSGLAFGLHGWVDARRNVLSLSADDRVYPSLGVDTERVHEAFSSFAVPRSTLRLLDLDTGLRLGIRGDDHGWWEVDVAFGHHRTSERLAVLAEDGSTLEGWYDDDLPSLADPTAAWSPVRVTEGNDAAWRLELTVDATRPAGHHLLRSWTRAVGSAGGVAIGDMVFTGAAAEDAGWGSETISHTRSWKNARHGGLILDQLVVGSLRVDDLTVHVGGRIGGQLRSTSAILAETLVVAEETTTSTTQHLSTAVGGWVGLPITIEADVHPRWRLLATGSLTWTLAWEASGVLSASDRVGARSLTHRAVPRGDLAVRWDPMTAMTLYLGLGTRGSTASGSTDGDDVVQFLPAVATSLVLHL